LGKAESRVRLSGRDPELNRRIPQHELGIRLAVRRLGDTKKWVSRHGVFNVSLDERGRVVSKHHGGETRVEFPWRSWWHTLTGK
jgi:hypothetical protein